MKKEMQHTPTPWEVNGFSIRPMKSGERYIVIPSPQRHDAAEILANAAFIVRAVNCHEELLDLAIWVRDSLKADERPENVGALIAKAEEY